MTRSFNIFDKLSKKVNADIDKVLFDKDIIEKKKLERSLRKQTMKERTRLIEK